MLLLVVGVTLALGWILLPLYGTLSWSAIIALLFAPLHRRLLLRLKHRRTLADFDTLQRWVNTPLENGSGFIATQAFSLGQNTFGWSSASWTTCCGRCSSAKPR